ncbi:AGAP011978-PA-like protein [Anopheles sinensis]|uniref:AGAP011978-PA-like protein n=1 Tax=Anopheles sinensis TaxID=74873 RepID=A0A084W9C2_ANOSI|nr:AGAP011978-PA-like protein [Anopheles sinensis]
MASLFHLGFTLRQKFLERFFIFSDSVDYFNLFNTFGTLFALHYDAKGPRKLFWMAYRALYVLSYLSYCYKAGWMFNHWEYNTASANVLGALGLCSGAFLRMLLIEHHYPAIEQLQRFLNDRTYQGSDPSWARQRRSRMYRQNNRFLVILVSAIVLESLCFLARLLLTRREFMLQFNGEVVGGSMVQIVYGTITAGWGIVYVLSFILFYMLMEGFRLEMEILVRSFQHLEDSLFPKHGEFIRTGLPMCEQNELAFWSDLKLRLNERIGRHVELLQNLRKLRSIVAPFAFLQYYSTFGLIADSFFIVSFEGFSGYSMAYILFASFLILESFLLSRGVEQLTELNHQIGMALYEFDWPKLMRYSTRFRREYNGIRRTMLLTIVQTQRSLKFTYGAQGEISMNSFAELMQKSYSMLTFMLQLGH